MFLPSNSACQDTEDIQRQSKATCESFSWTSLPLISAMPAAGVWFRKCLRLHDNEALVKAGKLPCGQRELNLPMVHMAIEKRGHLPIPSPPQRSGDGQKWTTSLYNVPVGVFHDFHVFFLLICRFEDNFHSTISNHYLLDDFQFKRKFSSAFPRSHVFSVRSLPSCLFFVSLIAFSFCRTKEEISRRAHTYSSHFITLIT